MKLRGFLIFVTVLLLGVCLNGETVDGTIIIKKRLTKRRVTASIPMYERGPVVELGADRESDPIAFERSRVVVYLEGHLPSSPDFPVVARMEQVSRRFSPELLVIEAGSKVSFPNLDPVFHNVFSLSNAKMFDLGNFPKGDTRIVTFLEPGIVSVNCHLHPNMAATIVVAPNKWYARSNRDGHFEIQDVPPGQYTVVAWHKAAGYLRQQVRISPGRNEHMEFLIPVDEDGRKIESSMLEPRGR